MSYKVEVLGKGETRWVSNALRFRTRKEAELYSGELYSRWMGMEAGRVATSRDPVNYVADKYGRARPISASVYGHRPISANVGRERRRGGWLLRDRTRRSRRAGR